MASSDAAARVFTQLYDRIHYMNQPEEEQTTFEPNEIMDMRLCWNAWVGGDLSGRGFEMFCKMFEQKRETQQVFSFATGSNMGQMQNSNKVLFHVTRVMKYINDVVQHVDRLDEVVPMLRAAGGRHGVNGYDIPGGYFPHLGYALRTLLKANYKGYNSRLDDCWSKLWNFIVIQMQRGQEMYGGGSS